MSYRLLRDQWFLAGIALVTALTLWNPVGLDRFAEFLARRHASEWSIAAIFLLSGLELEIHHLVAALRDVRGILLALAANLLLAPLLAWMLSKTGVPDGIRVGLILIGVVPTTLASGVVMTGAAGGSLAHALVITVAANVAGIITVPAQLSWMLRADGLHITLPLARLSASLGLLVLAPLAVGLAGRRMWPGMAAALPFKFNLLSRLIVLLIIGVGLHKGRESILHAGVMIPVALGLAVLLHLLLAGALWLILRATRCEAGRRESIFFMGIQKTLPLSVWLQTIYFPQYGMALVVCIFYHLGQLVMDSFFVGWMASRRRPGGD